MARSVRSHFTFDLHHAISGTSFSSAVRKYFHFFVRFFIFSVKVRFLNAILCITKISIFISMMMDTYLDATKSKHKHRTMLKASFLASSAAFADLAI